MANPRFEYDGDPVPGKRFSCARAAAASTCRSSIVENGSERRYARLESGEPGRPDVCVARCPSVIRVPPNVGSSSVWSRNELAGASMSSSAFTTMSARTSPVNSLVRLPISYIERLSAGTDRRANPHDAVASAEPAKAPTVAALVHRRRTRLCAASATRSSNSTRRQAQSVRIPRSDHREPRSAQIARSRDGCPAHRSAVMHLTALLDAGGDLVLCGPFRRQRQVVVDAFDRWRPVWGPAGSNAEER